MANLNKIMLIGRLTRDPELRSFSTGGRVAKFGFAVNNRKKNAQTGEWEDDPVFLDCEAFNRGEFGKLADLVERFLHKGSQAYIEGHMQLDRWDDKATGEKRSKLKVVVDAVQFLDPKPAGDGAPGRAAAPPRSTTPAPSRQGGYEYDDAPMSTQDPNGEQSDLPF